MASVGRAGPSADPAALEPGAPQPAASLEGALRRVARRVRFQRALTYAATLGVAGAGVAGLAVCLLKTRGLPAALAWFGLAVLLPLLGLAAGALRPVSPLLAARLLDRALGRSDLLASAWSFERMPAEARSDFMQACIRQARAVLVSAPAAPSRALPLRAPRALRAWALLLFGLAVLAAVEVKVPARVAAARPARARLLHQDDVQAFQHEVAPLLEARAADPFVQETARELNALLEALHEGELDRGKALAELRALEKKLEIAATTEDDAALREALRGVGRALERDALADSVAKAMQDADAAKARAELEKLADELRRGGQKPEALRNLAKALERSGKPKPPEKDALARAREELDRLLKKRAQAKAPDEREERLLRDKRRELERLQREQAKRDLAERKLDRLRRELSKASPPLQGNRGAEAGQQLEQAAQELGRAQSRQLSAEQREQLRERVAQLRELISKQRGEGQQQQQQQGERGGQAGNRQGQPQRLDLERMARLSRGKPGQQPQAGGDAQGNQGEPGKPGGKLLVPGQGGESDATLLLPGEGNAKLQMEGGEESALQGTQAGEGGRPQSAEATRLRGGRVDTRVQGAEGQGATRSEVIREAGQRGFVSRDYERVHGDYERHAEAVLERDRIPGGYRFYVRRYFQLIRPREGEP